MSPSFVIIFFTILTVAVIKCDGSVFHRSLIREPQEPPNEAWSQPTSNPNAKTIADLPMELLLSIYSDFDLFDLINIADSHPTNRAAAEILFHRKYSNETIKIHKPTSFQGKSFDLIRLFGHLITKLKIDFQFFDQKQSSQLSNYINGRCSESLIQLNLFRFDEKKLMFLRGPFKNLYILKMAGNLRENTLKFNEIFPSVRILNLREMYYTAPGCFERPFHQLEHLDVESWHGEFSSSLKVLEKRFELNPQLKQISFDRCNWQVLKSLSTNCPRIERMEIDGFQDFSSYTGTEIHFPALKSLKFQMVSVLSAGIDAIPMVFGNLEEIAFYKPFDQWMKIVVDNKLLKRITTGEINNKVLVEIADNLPNLQELKAICNGIDDENVVQFVQSSEMLKKLSLENCEFDIRRMTQKLGDEWHCRSENGVIFIGKV